MKKSFVYQCVLSSTILASSILMVSCDEEANVVSGAPAEDSLEAVVTDEAIFLQFLDANTLVLNADSITSQTTADSIIFVNNFENGNHIALNGNEQIGQINIHDEVTYPDLSVDGNVLTVPEVITNSDTDPELENLVLTATEIERDSDSDFIEYSGVFTIDVTSRIDGFALLESDLDVNGAESFEFQGGEAAYRSVEANQPSLTFSSFGFVVAPGDIIFSYEVVTNEDPRETENELYVMDGDHSFSNATDAIANAEVYDASTASVALDANGQEVFRLVRQSAPESVINVSGTFEWAIEDESSLGNDESNGL